ncbi:MAG: hypothetical protein HYX80_09925 [Chloroflexi bacterium]|nr:hypothetical protein [Chloroflexota bacterium]
MALDYGGLHAAEGLLLARYFMFLQVYFHDIRVSYDIHLTDFLAKWLPGGKFPSNLAEYLKYDDIVVQSHINGAADDPTSPQHLEAQRLTQRRHFRTAYEVLPLLREKTPDIFQILVKEAEAQFGKDRIRSKESQTEFSSLGDILVVTDNGPVNILHASDVIRGLKPRWLGRIYTEKKLTKEVHDFCESIVKRTTG